MKFSIILFCLLAGIRVCGQMPVIGSGVYHWEALAVQKSAERESRKILEGTTNEFSFFHMHATTHYKGVTPRPPHKQEDLEELIIVKEGKVKCTLDDQQAVLGPESVILVPPQVSQTFENVGDGPLTYYVLMFRSKNPMNLDRGIKAGGPLLLDADKLENIQKNGKGAKKYFDRPTAMCENYEMHITTLTEKGPSHAPHQHLDTEIILIIEGEAEMTIDGKTYKGKSGDFFLAESGSLHGVANASDKICRYFAFKWR